MIDPSLIAIPWQDDPEPPDAHLDDADRYDTEDDGLFYVEGVIDSLFDRPDEP